MIPQLKTKYEEKNDLIDACDKVFDEADASIQQIDELL
jgi:hypothetical protein